MRIFLKVIERSSSRQRRKVIKKVFDPFVNSKTNHIIRYTPGSVQNFFQAPRFNSFSVINFLVKSRRNLLPLLTMRIMYRGYSGSIAVVGREQGQWAVVMQTLPQ